MNQPPPNWQPPRPPGQPSQPSWPPYAPSPTPPPIFFSPQLPKPHIPNWLIYILIIIFCVSAGYAWGFSAGSSHVRVVSTDSVATPQAATTPQSQPTQASGTWTTVQTFSGNGNKKTQLFTIGDNWRINWTCHGFPDGVDGALVVAIDNADSTPLDFAAVNARCKGAGTTSDTTNEHQGGQVFLSVTATGDWSITVQDYS